MGGDIEPGPDFGCVPHQVVEDLGDIGNWKVRAAAVEALHCAVLDIHDKLVVLPTLSKFLQFLMSLVADPNFKISLSAMRIVQDLLGKLGTDIQPYLGTVMETLINKLGDRNEMVRQGDMTVMAALMSMLGPQPVLNALGGAFVHPDWRVREQGLSVVLQALLSHARDKFDYPTVVRAFSEGASDENERVRTASLEGLATLHERLGALLQGLLTTVGASDAVKRHVADRIKSQLPTPYLNVDGLVEQQAHARPASAGKPKAPKPSAQTSAHTPVAPTGNAPAVSSTTPASPIASACSSPALGAPAGLPSAAFKTEQSRAADESIPGEAARPSWAGGLQREPEGSLPAQEGTQPGWDSPAASATRHPGLDMYTPFASLAASPPAAYYIPPAEEEGMEGEPLAEPGGAMQMVDRYPSWSSYASSTASANSPDAGIAAADVVEQSGDSLLRWVRPSRGSTQQPSRQSTSTRTAGSTSPAASKRSALQPGTGADHGKAAGRSSSFNDVPARSPMAATAPTRCSLSPVLSGPAAAYSPDLYASLAGRVLPGSVSPAGSARSSLADSSHSSLQPLDSSFVPAPMGIQHRRPGGASSLSSASAGRYLQGTAEVRPAEPQSSACLAAQRADGEPEVEARSESLLLWRLPARPSATAKNSPGQDATAAKPRSQVPGPPASGNVGAQPLAGSAGQAADLSGGSTAIGSSGILQKLDGFKRKLFGSDSPKEAASGPWSIPAIRTEAPQTVSRPASQLGAAQYDDESSQQCESPTKGAAKLSKLKLRQQEAAERRRVWSAPGVPPSQRTTLTDPEDGLGQPSGGALLDAPELGSASDAASPARPGLQALKVRARTARISLGPQAQQPGSPQYGMDVLNDVFGPDRATLTTAWSPFRQASSPGRLNLPTRARSPSWQQPPGSPGSASSSPSAYKRHGTGFLQKLNGSPGDADPNPAAFSPVAADMSPVDDPEGTMRQLLQALEQANMSQKKELDWQSQYEALSNARRIIHNHASVLLPFLHPFVLAAAPVIDALRSIPARLAISVFQELIEALGPALDSELEHLIPILVKKAGVLSVAGRDNFLAMEADNALASLVNIGNESRVVTALLNCLSNTKAADMKGKIAMHLDACVQRHGHHLIHNAPATSKLLKAAVAFLDEGGLEARTSGKRILWEVRRLMDVGLGPEEFRKALGRLEAKTDKVWDIFEQGRPPPPVRNRSPSAGSPATPSFQALSPGCSRPSLLSASAAAYPALTETNLAMGSGHHSTLTYQVSNPPAAPSPAGTRPEPPALRPAVSFKTLTLGGDVGLAGISASGTATKTGAGASSLRRQRPASGRLSGTVAAADLDPALQDQMNVMQQHLGSKDWRERTAALESLRQVAPQLGKMPGDAFLRITDDVAQRITDANLKVQLLALEVLQVVFMAGGGEGIAAGLNTLVPALCKALDSSNNRAAQLATEALDAMIRSMDAALYIQPYMQAFASSSNVRSKAVLLDRLQGMVAGLYSAKPQLVTRHILGPLFAALGDKKLEVKGPLSGVLAALAGCMGLDLLDSCMSMAPAHRLMMSELVSQQARPA